MQRGICTYTHMDRQDNSLASPPPGLLFQTYPTDKYVRKKEEGEKCDSERKREEE